MRKITQIFILILLFLLTNCSRHIPIDPPGLSNAGILPLSRQDAFVGSNLFLAKEMERSPYLHHFIETRGAPDAIEVIERSFDDTKVLLYYPQEKSVYSMVPRDGHEKLRQWVIRGPFQINWKDLKELNRLHRDKYAQPIFFIWGQEKSFQEKLIQPVARVIHPVIPPPPPPVKKKVVKKKVKKTADSHPEVIENKGADLDLLTLDPKKFKPLNTDQQAIFISKGYVERSPSGDAVHTVRTQTETFDRIARWYTGSSSNSEAIAKENNMTLADSLSAGMVVRVPIGLLKTAKAMPLNYN